MTAPWAQLLKVPAHALVVALLLVILHALTDSVGVLAVLSMVSPFGYLPFSFSLCSAWHRRPRLSILGSLAVALIAFPFGLRDLGMTILLPTALGLLTGGAGIWLLGEDPPGQPEKK